MHLMLICSRESTCSACSSWSDKPGNVPKKEEFTLLDSGSWLRRRSRRKPCLILQTKKLDGITTPYGPAARGRTHPGGNSKGTFTQRSVSTGHRPPATGRRSTSHRSTGHRPFAQWTRRHHRFAGHWPPAIGHWSMATGQMGITQEISCQSITGHRSSSHRSLDLENINTGENQYSPATGHWSTGHRSLVIRLYINLHLVGLMPWAWSSLIITQKEFYYP